MAHLVTAPLVLVRNRNGGLDYHYEGSVIPWLSDEQAKHFLSEGLVEESDGGPEADDGRPKKAAPKADWVEFAVADGYDRDEVEAMNKADIQALFD